MTNVTIAILIHYAYGLRGPAGSESRILGLPAWAETARYDVVGVSEIEVDRTTLLAMLRPVLAGRFGLKFHWETRETWIYSLAAGKNGPKFHAWKEGDPETHMRKMTMDTLVHMLASSETTGHNPIVDRTGLADFYDLSVLSKSQPRNDVPTGTIMDQWLARLPDELGLELRREKGSAQVLQVDDVKRVPIEN